MSRTSWRDWLWVLTCAALSTIWIVSAARQLSATYDETTYLKVGLERWRTGSFGTLKHIGTMPLPVDVCTLPLFLGERATGHRIDIDAEMADWLPIARAGALPFWWLPLIYAWRTGNRLAGPWAGRWASALLAVEPTFLGHAGLATTDVASAACLLAFAFHYRTACDRTGWRGWFAPVCWCGVALLAKASAVVYAPICMFAAECDYRWRAGPLIASWRDLVSQLIRAGLRVAAVLGLGFVLATIYCGGVNHVRDVIAFQLRHNRDGHGGTYLLGSWSAAPLWYYFPALLTIKLPLPLLAAPVLIAIVRPRVLANWSLAAAGVILLASLTCHIQIGIRYLLPGIAFAVVGLAAAGMCAWQRSAPQLRRCLSFACGVTVIAMAINAVQIWPDGLSYTNGLWGPADRGYLLVSDSNYDWGQGLYELADWQRQNGNGPLDVIYFGTDPALPRLNMRPISVNDLNPDDFETPRKLAVSTTILYGQPHSPNDPARRLLAQTPAARTTTFLIYDLPLPGG